MSASVSAWARGRDEMMALGLRPRLASALEKLLESVDRK